MMKADFVATATPLANGEAGATIRTAPTCARPSPGSSVLLETADGWRIAVVGVVLSEADGCGELISIVSLFSAGTPV